MTYLDRYPWLQGDREEITAALCALDSNSRDNLAHVLIPALAVELASWKRTAMELIEKGMCSDA